MFTDAAHACVHLDLPSRPLGNIESAVLDARTPRPQVLRTTLVLEVVDRRGPDSYLVASGFGTKARWFRNIGAHPRVRVYVGSHRPAPATARVLDQSESDSAVADYRSRHPRSCARFKAVLDRGNSRQRDHRVRHRAADGGTAA